MKERLKRIRNKLDAIVEKYGLNSKETKKVSKRFDEVLNEYYKKEVQYPENSFIYLKYDESINYLKEIARKEERFPTIQEWNKYAKKHELLSSESIKYISGVNWHELRNRTINFDQ
jgi:hypothetical protein